MGLPELSAAVFSFPLDLRRSLPGLLQMFAIQTHVRTRRSATAWTGTSTARVLKATREKPVNGSRKTARRHLVKVTGAVSDDII